MNYLVFAVLFFHILVVAQLFNVKLYVDSDSKNGEIAIKLFFVPLFVKKFNVDIDNLFKLDETKTDNKTKDKRQNIKSKKKMLKFVFELIKRIRVRYFFIDARIGLGEPHYTAFIVGFINIILSQVCNYLSIQRNGEVVPFYDYLHIDLYVNSIFSLCLGDIIYIVIKRVFCGIFKRKKRRKIYGNNVFA